MFSIEKRTYGEKNKRVVIVFAGWGMKQWQLWLLGRLLASYSFKAIIFTWDRAILTPDIKLTLERFTQVRDEALRTVDELPKKEKKQIAVFGISMGTILAVKVADILPTIDRMILTSTGSDLAEIVWSWERVIPGLKEKLIGQELTLKKLKRGWASLAPYNNLDNIRAKHVLIYLSDHDELIPFNQQKKLFDALKEKGMSVEAMINTRHGHLPSILINLLRFPVYINFLKRR